MNRHVLFGILNNLCVDAGERVRSRVQRPEAHTSEELLYDHSSVGKMSANFIPLSYGCET